jgi:hypothetical protein
MLGDGLQSAASGFSKVQIDAREGIASALHRQYIVMARAARAAIDALKWTAGKRQPKKYGDKLDLDINGRVQIERVEVKFVGDGE